jgi:TPR repeat protein
MMSDFSGQVANLLFDCSAHVAAMSPAPVVEAPVFNGVVVEETLYRALAGDAEAQVKTSETCLLVAQTIGGMGAPYLEKAEGWARNAAEAGSARGAYRLADVLLYRAGLLAGAGFSRLAGQLAGEALDLLNRLADDGFEQAALTLITAFKELAEVGIYIAPRAQREG